MSATGIPPIDVKNIPLPCCPFCEAEMPAMGLYCWMLEMWMILCTYCPACRAMLHQQIVPAAMMAPPESSIARPS